MQRAQHKTRVCTIESLHNYEHKTVTQKCASFDDSAWCTGCIMRGHGWSRYHAKSIYNQSTSVNIVKSLFCVTKVAHDMQMWHRCLTVLSWIRVAQSTHSFKGFSADITLPPRCLKKLAKVRTQVDRVWNCAYISLHKSYQTCHLLNGHVSRLK